ncbi:ethanolamine ammonia-lyase subunit EutC [Clostridium sp. CM028]|uniref:ethanolamine ammonia-lyase subunit EutC n=1 Tax=unclassified Clostridium TaxID=2614128 RepID=UPI001C0BD41F|nr:MULTISPECIES: ethanolamine ammonia-lyase subunit EutC [unclassified Clostridium]MBU3092661.1 ethanolamine ammonia-lyase subunit EutC [Clostridium sp. CF011]MBW9145297.1 ethanolamine ammonia-lyase subunit EutC [Clostridium sp. CM027]MBW9148889.1 ethanolamine ammonia-lyase subunit EutC [Clostridium sp. CM028]UVE42437.1 ethanolamine ammonia-lyase subunit EutC [Clostridium sp. CM027]WAG71456.1 ethanolamine ammonia-lyase subunit EutC [Clostridium sp. CF011]
MVSENDLKKLVEQVLLEMTSKDKKVTAKVENSIKTEVEDGFIDDITTVDIKKQLLVPNPADAKGYLKMKESTPARLGIWRAGPRYKTETALRVRADHAAAQDSVFSDVSEEFLKEMNLFSVKTECINKDEFITRPDLGKKITEEGIKAIKTNCKMRPQVQIYVSDGLSSAAIEANIRDVLPAMVQGLEGYRISVGTPFFVKNGRVGVMDVVSETLEADVTCVLIGERPGLVTAESMSAYIAYKATVNMPEARRTVVSNIHKGGTPPVEAGAHISDIIKLMLEKKASGVDLKL